MNKFIIVSLVLGLFFYAIDQSHKYYCDGLKRQQDAARNERSRLSLADCESIGSEINCVMQVQMMQSVSSQFDSSVLESEGCL